MEILTDQFPGLTVVDCGYRDHDVEKTQVLIEGSKRGLTPALKTLLRRRSAIEPEIGHMKATAVWPDAHSRDCTVIQSLCRPVWVRSQSTQDPEISQVSFCPLAHGNAQDNPKFTSQ